MSDRVLLDANVLIKAINNKQGVEAQLLRELSLDPQKTIYITPLIRYEVLRGVNWCDVPNYQDHIAFLNSITMLNIDKHISDKAADIFRFEKAERETAGQQAKKIDKYNFDVMHFATAKVYSLQMISNDKDMQAWEALHQAILKSR